MKRLFFLIYAMFSTLCLYAQEKSEKVDSLVSLLSAKSIELIEKNGTDYRKVTGPARFLHNNTYLICDTALWNVNSEEIEAIGNVKILQNETVLTSEKLLYLIPQDLAQFRGALVQLEDKDHNILRTRHLDYNTRDSIAVFQNGGALKDKDGQIIESQTGTYDSKIKTFTFVDNVNMFTDSIFVKTTRLEYRTDLNLANFGYGTDAWKEDNMLSSNSGWYDRNKELFFFNKNVHGMTPDREGWADSLYFHRLTMNVEMLGNVQISDTSNNVSALAGRIVYTDSLSRIELTRDPAVIGISEGENQPSDTLYFGADSMVYRTVQKFKIDSLIKAAAKTRKENLSTDAIMTYRKKAAEEAAKAAEEAAKNDPNKIAEAKSKEIKEKKEAPKDTLASNKETAKKDTKKKSPQKKGNSSKKEVSDSLKTTSAPPLKDSLYVKDTLNLRDSLSSPAALIDSLAQRDSLALKDSLARRDSLAVADSLANLPKDSTKIGFFTAIKNARLFREDVQIACDSLEYSDLDSLIRLFGKPLVWNEKGRHQYSSDSLYAEIRNGRMTKANLLSNSFIIVQELDTISYDQIRGAEMLAYFDSTSALKRFDALGEASAVFYIKEDSVFSTVNKSQAKMLCAEFKDGEIQSMAYFQEIKNDVFPLAQMKTDDKVLKGFEWQPEKRPKSRYDVTALQIRPTERESYAKRPRASYEQTDIYFPGYMKGVYKQIAERKEAEAKRAREKAEKARLDSIARAADSLAVKRDSLALKDSLKTHGADSLEKAADSLSVSKDSLASKDSLNGKLQIPDTLLSPKEAAKRARKAMREEKQKEREAKWAQLDSLDAMKARLKEEKKAAKLRARKLAALKAAMAQDAKEKARLEKYKAMYEKRKARLDARAAKKKKTGPKYKTDKQDKAGTEENPVEQKTNTEKEEASRQNTESEKRTESGQKKATEKEAVTGQDKDSEQGAYRQKGVEQDSTEGKI